MQKFNKVVIQFKFSKLSSWEADENIDFDQFIPHRWSKPPPCAPLISDVWWLGLWKGENSKHLDGIADCKIGN